MRSATLSLVSGILVSSALAGCGGGENAALIAQQRPRLLLGDEPDGAQQISDVRTALMGESGVETTANAAIQAQQTALDEQSGDGRRGDENAAGIAMASGTEVVVVGVVGGVANPYQESRPDFPFAKGEATFFLADVGTVAELEADGHQHAAGEECAFCAAHAEDNSKMLAVVQFKDENGKVLPVDARELFDLKEEETVVVRGAVSVGAGETLVLDATGLYIRR